MTARVRSSVKSHLHENICCASAIASCIYCVGLYVGSHQEALVAPLLCCLIKFILTWYHTGWQTQCGEEMFIAGIVDSWVKLLELKCFDLLVLFFVDMFGNLTTRTVKFSDSAQPLHAVFGHRVHKRCVFFTGSLQSLCSQSVLAAAVTTHIALSKQGPWQ